MSKGGRERSHQSLITSKGGEYFKGGEASAQPTEEHASTADDNQAAEENEEVRAIASVAPEETEPNSSAPPSQTTSPTLPSASKVNKTKVAERAAVKKRKSSASSEPSAPKKVKTLTSSYANPIDVVPLSSMPSKEILPFGEDYMILSESDEDDAFLFFTATRFAALVFFTSEADGRIGVGVGAGGAEEFG